MDATTATTTTPPVTTPTEGQTTTTTTSTETTWINPDGSFAQGWTDKLPEDVGERSSFGKFKSVSDLAKSYKHLESRLGKAANAVLVPGEDAKPEEIAAYRKAIGALDSAEEYAKIKPENLPEGVQWNDDLAKPLYDIAAKYNIPKAALEEYMQVRIQQEAGRVGVAEQMLEQELQKGTELLQKEWGNNYKPNIERVASAVKMVGFNPDEVNGLRDPDTVKLIHALSSKLSEDTWQREAGNTNGPGMNARDIMTNPSNPLHERYVKGEEAVVSQVRRLLAQEAERAKR